MACIDFAQIVELNIPQVQSLTQAAQENPNPALDHARRAFSSQVHLVECAIRNTYAMAATLARRTE